MARWLRAGEVNEVEEGRPVCLKTDEWLIGIFRVEERFYAVSNLCTHQGAVLSDGWQDGTVIECPLHQARFDVTTGKCLGAPAEHDLTVFDVKVEEGEIYVLVPAKSTHAR